jgi:DNA-binding GntR family transcriptional regulator
VTEAVQTPSDAERAAAMLLALLPEPLTRRQLQVLFAVRRVVVNASFARLASLGLVELELACGARFFKLTPAGRKEAQASPRSTLIQAPTRKEVCYVEQV